MSGWIKLHRGLTEWEWYTDANTMRTFIHCLLKANHTAKKWRGHDIERGQFIGSYESVAKDLNLTVSKVRTSLKKLILTGEMTIKGGNQHTVFTIENYESYQGLAVESQTDDNQIAIKSQTDDNQIAPTKNDNNENNEKNSNPTPAKKAAGKKFSDEDMRLVEWMVPLIKNVSPKFKQPNAESWANTIRLMRESDKLDHKYIAQVFKWANQDGFWKTNIMSPAKLREKFAALDAKRLSGNNGSNSPSSYQRTGLNNIDRTNTEL